MTEFTQSTLKKLGLALALGASVSVQASPIFNLFELGVQPQAEELYQAVGEQNIRRSLQEEAGTLAMYSVRQTANPYLAYMVEIYADEKAYQAHLASPQYQHFLQQSPQILTEHKKRIELTPHFLGDKKVEQTAKTRTNLVIVEVKPEFNQAFAEVVLPEMQQSLVVEEGVLAMYAASEKNEPNRWYFFEIYQSDEAYALHRQTPHFQQYLQQTQAMLQHKQSIDIVPSLLANQGNLNYSQFVAQ